MVYFDLDAAGCKKETASGASKASIRCDEPLICKNEMNAQNE